jgi:hypothetical protein
MTYLSSIQILLPRYITSQLMHYHIIHKQHYTLQFQNINQLQLTHSHTLPLAGYLPAWPQLVTSLVVKLHQIKFETLEVVLMKTRICGNSFYATILGRQNQTAWQWATLKINHSCLKHICQTNSTHYQLRHCQLVSVLTRACGYCLPTELPN